MQCPHCNYTNPDGAKFCDECGAKLERTCPSCGKSNPPVNKFCYECGSRLADSEAGTPASSPGFTSTTVDYQSRLAVYTPKHLAEKILTTRSALEGERRLVTVLFTDTASFTSLAEKLDPEDVHQIMDRCFELITGAVHRFEGTINQYTGDGVMALFGAPIAHEDGPRRAIHAALAIQQGLREFSKELQARRGFELQMRIGLNTGLVVVGKIGDDLRMDYTAVGDTTNVAARMQQLARPGSVVVSEATHKLIDGFFDMLDLGVQQVKGHTPVQTFEVLRPRNRRARLDVAVERGLTPLIGREREFSFLCDTFQQAKTGHGQVVLLTGEAGIGKSRLLLELRRALEHAGEQVTWLEGRCISFGQSIPLLPIIDQLREHFGIEEIDGEPEIIAKVEHGMRQMDGLEPSIPYIRYLLSVDPGELTIAALDPLVRRRQAFEALRALALHSARRQPLVLVFEDLHWIDSSSEEYLSALVDSVTGLPVLLILTYRIGYTPPFGNRSFFTTLNLHSLSEAEMVTMASRVLGSAQFPEELKAALLDKAEGVPLFVEAVTKTLLDLGVLRREKGGYRLVKGLDEVSVPNTIQGIIMARLDRLGEDGKRTVQLASVIGRQFLVRLLERIAGFSSKLEGLLKELKTLEIVYEHGLVPEPAYIFKHAVIQDVAYNSLLMQRRKELHRAVGAAIEELYADRLPEHYEELAHHYERAEAWEKALEYLVKAGQKLQQSYANKEALAHYERALAVCERPGVQVDPAVVLTLYAGKGTMLFFLSQPHPAIEAYQHMLEIARQCGNQAKEAEALQQLSLTFYTAHEFEQALAAAEQAKTLALAIGSKHILAGSFLTMSFVHETTGKIAPAIQLSEQSLHLSREAGDKNTEGLSLVLLGMLRNFRGEYAPALQFQEQAFTIGQDHLLVLPLIWSLWTRSLSLCGRGDDDKALESLQKALELSTRLDDKVFRCRILNTYGWVYGELHHLDTAMKYNQEAVELSYTVNDPEIIRNAELNLGDNYLFRGDSEQAQQFLEKVYRDSQQRGKWGEEYMKWRYMQHCCHSLGELWLQKGDPEKARLFAEECLQLAEPTGSRKNIVKGWRLQGQAYCMQGKLAEAETVLQKSLMFAKEVGNPPQLWKTYQALGELYEQQGASAQARSAYAGACEVIEGVASRLQDQAMKETFLAARPVQELRGGLKRLTPP